MATQRTLLGFVKTIGSVIGADFIDELDETTEAYDIKENLRMAWEEILDREDWDFNTFNTANLNDSTAAINALELPTDILNLDDCTLRYRIYDEVKDEQWQDVRYVSPSEFLYTVQSLNEEDDTVDTVTTASGIVMLINNNREPDVYTTFDGRTIYFDAYNSDAGSSIVGTDVVILGTFRPSMDWDDPDATFPIPQRMETLLLHSAISLASNNIRQVGNGKSEQIARRQFNKLRSAEPTIEKNVEVASYGRRGKRSRSSW